MIWDWIIVAVAFGLSLLWFGLVVYWGLRVWHGRDRYRHVSLMQYLHWPFWTGLIAGIVVAIAVIIVLVFIRG
jgi:hypothetical protein